MKRLALLVPRLLATCNSSELIGNNAMYELRGRPSQKRRRSELGSAPAVSGWDAFIEAEQEGGGAPAPSTPDGRTAVDGSNRPFRGVLDEAASR